MSFEKLYVINRCYAGKMYRVCIIDTVVVAHQLVILVDLHMARAWIVTCVFVIRRHNCLLHTGKYVFILFKCNVE